MNNLISQAYKELERISANRGINESDLTIIQEDKSTVYFSAIAFGKHTERFTVSLTPTGKVKKLSVRFYE